MKKLICLLSVLFILLTTISLANAEDIDLSELSFDELVALKSRIDLAIWQTDEWQEVTVPQGVWKVGEDIPAGKWTVTCAPGYRDFKIVWGELLEANGQEIKFEYKTRYDWRRVYNPDHKYYEIGDGETSYTFEVNAGDYIVITDGAALFSPFAGKPSLGFK